MARGRPRKAGKSKGSGSQARKDGPIASLDDLKKESGDKEALSVSENGSAKGDCDTSEIAEPIREEVVVRYEGSVKMSGVQSNASGKKKRRKGPNSSSDKIKMKSIEEVTSIVSIHFSDVSEDEIVERNGEAERAIMQGFVEENMQAELAIERGNPVINSPIFNSVSDNPARSGEKQKKVMVKITEEDIEDEIAFWNSALVCYVLGANSPLSVMEGFFRRI